MNKRIINCFKSYDIRGIIGDSIDEEIIYRISRATAEYLDAKKIVIAYDARETSETFSQAASEGIVDAGADVLFIGLAGTEEMYWAVSEFKCCGGIMITASHNPINYNGMKIVKNNSLPMSSNEDMVSVKIIAEHASWKYKHNKGEIIDISKVARKKYIDKVLSFVEFRNMRPIKVLVNCGNGALGPTFNQLEKKILENNKSLIFLPVLEDVNSSFPKGIPNPLIPQNQRYTSELVQKKKADFGVAFDGDFDRCFFFDEKGTFIPGEYIVGLLASIFLQKEKGATIIYDPRVVWSTKKTIESSGGIAIQSRTGHAFFKNSLRINNAVYGGEISAHHYFRDFAFCDSGIIPFLLILELLSNTRKSLGDLVSNCYLDHPSSGEINFRVEDPILVLQSVFDHFRKSAEVESIDGYSFIFPDWRFNLRASNTEPVIRLNIESKENKDLIKEKIEYISKIITPMS